MNLPPEQEAIRARCFHPSGTFVEFPIEDVETSIPARFEKIVATAKSEELADMLDELEALPDDATDRLLIRERE